MQGVILADLSDVCRAAGNPGTAAVMAYGAQPSYPDRSTVMALMPGQEERSSS